MNTRTFITILLVSIAIPAFSQDTTGVVTGKKIGTVVKTALDTALPGITTLLNLIWNKGDNAKMKKDELQTQLVQAKSQLMSDAQKKLEPMSQVATELYLINKFLIPSVNANINLIRMQTRLVSSNPLSKEEWDQQITDWQIAKNWIEKLKNIDDSDINTIRDIYIRNMLTKIRNANNESSIRLQRALDLKDSKSLAEQLKELANSLNDIPVVVGYELGDLQGDMKDLGQWAKAGMGGSPNGLTDQQKLYKDILTKRYPNN